MGFDINKYNDEKFHEDELVNKRIRALMLWYEYQVFRRKLSRHDQLTLLNKVIDTTIRQEWYEITEHFKNIKIKFLTEDL
jgi:hypothetical protein